MKKILLLGIVILFGLQVFAYNYDADFKKSYYDGFIVSMFNSLQNSLLSQGFNSSSVNSYISTMKSRLNRTQLENATWSCVSKYSYQDMVNNSTTVYNDCFDKWLNNFFFVTNKDVSNVLKK